MLSPAVKQRLAQIDAQLTVLEAAHRPPARYLDPVEYAQKVLKVNLWSVQEDIARALRRPPYKVLVKSAHSLGKTFLAAVLVSWWFDTFPDSSAVITTAPTARDVRDLLWREVRVLRGRAGLGGFRGEFAPELWDHEEHFAKGFTAKSGESFQGRHLKHMLFLMDEAIGIDAVFWDTTKSMFKGDGLHGWLAFANPTDPASQMYQEELAEERDGSPAWTVFSMSAPEHPNIIAELKGAPPPFPAAVSLRQFEGWIADWCDPLPAGEATVTDLEWPPGSGVWYRPGPQMESRGLGRWPSSGTYGVWSDALWQAALRQQPFVPDLSCLPVIGCDVARFGDDYTELHVRWGMTSLHHERHNGWPTNRTAGRLIELCHEYARVYNQHLPIHYPPTHPRKIPVHVDDGGVGGGVTDLGREHEYAFRPVLAQHTPAQPEKYVSVRDELWFTLAGRARRGLLDLSRLPSDILNRLRRQALAPLWQQTGGGQRQVESKAKTKARLPGLGSPDGMDAANLAYYEPVSSGIVVVTPEPISSRQRGMYGGWVK
jgi:hypothetical protein